ncbi:MAG: hypothetical protein Ct9H300mP28_37070 [Pseudomonadota bacterium]|nr:MAG: hypothetical protein Ct9H300mP28_37070 [Pseudomonadota bacterium]
MRNLKLELNSLETTEKVARKMAEHLFQGSIMLFWGDMGSGKTTFIKSLVPDLVFYPKKLLLLHIHLLNLQMQLVHISCGPFPPDCPRTAL